MILNRDTSSGINAGQGEGSAITSECIIISLCYS